jgi:hypothetical protein
MSGRVNAAELTVEQTWFIAETIGGGMFPWVLALTMPYTDSSLRGEFVERQTAELTRMGVLSAGGLVNPVVADWIRVVCFPERWLDLRYVGPAGSGQGGDGDLLRGVVARRDRTTVVALRNAQLVTFTAMQIDDPRALVPVLTVGLAQRPPARFDEFTLPARVGVRADERLRGGAQLTEVFDYLGIPASAREVIETVFTGPRSYVEIVAGCDHDGRHATTEVGVSVVDTTAGRILVRPSRAFDGEWVSTFIPGTEFSIAAAVESLTGELPDGQWFPGQRLFRDFSGQLS